MKGKGTILAIEQHALKLIETGQGLDRGNVRDLLAVAYSKLKTRIEEALEAGDYPHELMCCREQLVTGFDNLIQVPEEARP